MIVMSAPASSSLDASCQDTERLRIHLKQSSKGMHEAICEAACGPVDVAIPRAVNSERNCDTKLVIARSIQSWISGFRIDRFCAHSIRRLFLWAGTSPRPRIRRTTGAGDSVSAAGRDGLELLKGEAGHRSVGQNVSGSRSFTAFSAVHANGSGSSIRKRCRIL